MMKPERVFEVSWEVCNKVGGINTVIKSKAKYMTQQYAKYTLIGPYIKENAEFEFERKPIPNDLKQIFLSLEEEGVLCHYGVWNIQGEPEVILIDSAGMAKKKDELKTKYWDNYRVDSLFTSWEFEEPLLFSTAAGMIIDNYQKTTQEKTVGHFHEWMAGFGLLHLKSNNPRVATVFTTHATILGRSIAGNGQSLYADLDNIHPEQKAKELGVLDKFSAERACAQNATIFTTVSEITALEAEKILGRKPDLLLYNGVSMAKFPTIEETTILHSTNRERLRDFIAWYFYPYYTFDMEETMVYYTSGRFEYHNKGFDILVESLRRLNEELKRKDSPKTIVMFFWIPMGTVTIERTVMENKNAYYQIKNYVDWHAQTILKKLTWDFLICGSQDKQLGSGFYAQDFMQGAKKEVSRFKKEGNPPLLTHELPGKERNPLYQALLQSGLDNKPDDKVKIVLYPAYLDGADGLLNLSYYDAVVGGHLGIFPSYYEPWGYTPLESIALAVPAVTTDLAGFGRFVNSHSSKNSVEDHTGVWVLNRFEKTWEEEVQSLFTILKEHSSYDHAERVQTRLAAKTTASIADWKHFSKNYFTAHEKAVDNNENNSQNRE